MSSYRKMFFRKIRRLRALAKLARMEGIPRRGKKTRFDKQDRCRYIRSAYALQALEPAWIPVRQIKGLREEFEKFPEEKIEDISQNLEFLLFVKRYQLVEPLIKERDAVYESLTYSVRLYVPAGLTRKTSIKMQEQTVFIGNIPIMKGISISRRINSIPFDRYGYALQALEPAEIPIRQIEAGHWAIQRYLRSRGKLWVLPQKPPTKTTTDSEWDHSDKKSPRLIISRYSVYVISPGDILYEISGVSETIARRALALAANIMPIQTQFFSIMTYG